MGAHVTPRCCSVLRVNPSLSPRLQFRLRISCGKLARDVDDGGGDIAALQAQATLTLRQAAGMSFDRIMVSAGSVLRSHTSFA